MSEMVERVARALADVKEPFIRTNKARSDGLIYEVGYLDSEDDPVVVAAFANMAVAGDAREQLRRQLYGRAVIAAMREPTEEMVDAGAVCPFDDKDVGNLDAEARTIWAAMIDAALTQVSRASGTS